MKFEQSKNFITGVQRQRYLIQLQQFIQETMPTGVVSDETEAVRLQRRLLSGEPITEEEVNKIFGQLGSSQDRGSLYH